MTDKKKNIKMLWIFLLLLFNCSCQKYEPGFLPENPLEGTSTDEEDPEGSEGKLVDTKYATWIMLWNRASEFWWNPDEHNGVKVFVKGKWQSVNWMDHSQADEFVDDIKKAGIDILICDLTNGWQWLNEEVLYIQKLCKEKGMKICIAENSEGDVEKFEQHAKDIWDLFAGPEAEYFQDDTYLKKDGKPVIVCYSIRDWYNDYKNSNRPFTQKFNLVWASGEDSDKDKWGWQLEPWVASVPSEDVMFVTPAIKWTSGGDQNLWRSSLSWLDYNFLLAKKNAPEYVIVGSYDDLDERNGWLVANTEEAVPGLQMRDKEGALNPYGYYERVKEWIKGKPSVIKGGILEDGCYKIINKNSGKVMTSSSTTGELGGNSIIQYAASDNPLNDYFWLYHLGNGVYRILSLSKGFSIEVPDGGREEGIKIKNALTEDVPRQKWKIEKKEDEDYRIVNLETGSYLGIKNLSVDNGAAVVQKEKGEQKDLNWEFEKIRTIKD